MPVAILRDVGGVSGLHVALDVFTEDTERRLFKSSEIHNAEDAAHTHAERNGRGHTPVLPDDVYRCCNAVRDSGLFPDLITPDYCLALTYPGPSAAGGGASFQSHFDSRYRWGETVVGVNLGQGCIMEVRVPGTEPTLRATANHEPCVLRSSRRAIAAPKAPARRRRAPRTSRRAW